MTTIIYTSNYRKNLNLYWQQYYPDWYIPKGYHVHHIKPKCLFSKDDVSAHHPRNLIALHPDDHISIHKLRGDKLVNNNFLKISCSINHIGKNNPMYGKTHSEKTKNKMSENMRGTNHPLYRKTHSEKTKNKMSENMRGTNHPLYGKTHSEKTKNKIRLSCVGKRNGKNNPNADNKVYTFYNPIYGIFISNRHYAKDILKLSRTTMTNIIKYNGTSRSGWKII